MTKILMAIIAAVICTVLGAVLVSVWSDSAYVVAAGWAFLTVGFGSALTGLVLSYRVTRGQR